MHLSVDIGGTFTDFVVLEPGKPPSAFKILTSPKEPQLTVLEGLERVDQKLSELIHATTLGTNVLLGQSDLPPPKVALLVTKGFRDIIAIGRQNRPSLYDLFFQKKKLLVPNDLVFEVDERTTFDGRVRKKIDASEIEQIALRLKEKQVDSAAIVFLHSHANPANELYAKNVLLKSNPKVPISASSEIAPEPREYERGSTACVNALLVPIIAGYLRTIAASLAQKYSEARLLVMSSSGGLLDVPEAENRPVQLVESGPAAGVLACAELAAAIEEPRAISFDMGGTTAKTCAILDYQAETTTEYEVGGRIHHGRLSKGTGYPILFPFLDVAEVSSGGGTIIWRDRAGALKVGPGSAGSEPGPMCYDRGGKEPTLTDANVVLGRLGTSLLGGKMKVNRGLALQGFRALGNNPEEEAAHAIDLANLEMARAVRLVTVERGLDPGGFALVAFGGAGPQHAAEIAEQLSMRKVIIPPEPSVFSAIGLLAADRKFEVRASYPQGDVEDCFRKLEGDLEQEMALGGAQITFARYADARYAGQGWDLSIRLSAPFSKEELAERFRAKHEAVYGFAMDDEIQIATIRVFGIGKRSEKLRFEEPPRERIADVGQRMLHVRGEWIKAPVYLRRCLAKDFKADGPALIEEYGTTTYVPPNWNARSSRLGTIVLDSPQK